MLVILGFIANMSVHSSMLVGEKWSVFGNKTPESDVEEDTRSQKGVAVFSSSWLPGTDTKYGYRISLIFLFAFRSVISYHHLVGFTGLNNLRTQTRRGKRRERKNWNSLLWMRMLLRIWYSVLMTMKIMKKNKMAL